MKSKIPFYLIGIGILLLIAAGGTWLFSNFLSPPSEGWLPAELEGFPLSQAVFGLEAVAGVIQLHGLDFPLEDAAIGDYGTPGEITLWVSVEPNEETAKELLNLMTEKINLGRSPFTLPVLTEYKGWQVYQLEGWGQQHYYWQSGTLILWLAADEEIASQVLEACLAFYH